MIVNCDVNMGYLIRETYVESLIRNGEFEKLEQYKQKLKAYHHSRWLELKNNPAKLEEHYKKQTEWKNANPERIRASWKKQKSKAPEKWLLKQAKTRAKLKGHEFSLVLEDIIIPEICPIMGEKLEWIPYGFNPYSPSIDRIDSAKGYTKDNIQVISSIANRMKWNATKEQLLTFCKGVLSLEGRAGLL